MGAFFTKPWRDVPQDNMKNLSFVKDYKPQNEEVNHLRILLYGPIGAGKSSFINSVESVLKGEVTTRAPTDAISGTSFTKKYTTYKIHKDLETFYPLVFNDIMGFEQEMNRGVHVEDIKLALRGHVKEGYKFHPGAQLMDTDPYYNSSPTLDDRVHVLVSVIPVASVSLMSEKVVKKMKAIREAAGELGIPQLAILTRIDEACPGVKDNLKTVYASKYLEQKVDQCNMLLGLQPNCIFLVKNYKSETRMNEELNALILIALKQIISSGEHFLNSLEQPVDPHTAEAKPV